MRVLLLVLLLLPGFVKAQNYFATHFGASIGLNLQFGSHVNGIGVNVQGYYSDAFFQVNAGTSLRFLQVSYGKRRKFWENRSYAGLVLLAGKQNNPVNFVFDGLNHQQRSNYALGYNYIFYFDNAGTSQRSGGLALHLRQVSIYHENDFFAGSAGDCFRTAHFRVSYHNETYQAGAGINLWTGQTAGARRENYFTPKSPNGFKILEELPYGKTSHGILYASFQGALPYGQHFFLRAGIDSEHIRHAVQNRLIHDLAFLPGLNKKLKSSTPHYPRLDEFGCASFTKEGARKNRPFIHFGLNDNWAD